jgi:capsular polysaccharide transport system permease protein
MSPKQTTEPTLAKDATVKPVLTTVPPAATADTAPVRLSAGAAESGQILRRAPFSAIMPVPPAVPVVAPPMPMREAAPRQRDWAPASASRLQPRHKWLLASFFAMVVLPLIVSAGYLYLKAQDQYASTVGFSVQRESMDSAFSLVSGLASISGSSSPDTDIIYRYIYSQGLVSEVNAELDLQTIWNKAEGDIVFRLGAEQPIEDLVDYWQRMVKVHYDNSTRLIEVRVLAFDPDDARKIAALIFDKSTQMINRLNDAALQDAVRFSATELEKTRVDLVAARQAMTKFRNDHQLVDPTADAAAQMALVSSLEQSAAQTQIDLDLLTDTASPTDPRIPPLKRRLEVIEAQIKVERAKLGAGARPDGKAAMADIFADYEKLRVDQEFAEAAYQSARAAHEVALSEARRQSRFLAAHILPTMAESSRDPRRLVILATLALLLTLAWSIGSLIYYSLRDRR